MNATLNNYPYGSKRSASIAKNGMVATGHPLAAQVGLDILKQGGNAVDAAIATAAALTVVEPTTNGIGGDAFAIVNFENTLYGINGSGKSPKGLTLDALKKKGLSEIPKFGVVPITTPGAVRAWVDLSEQFGVLDFKTVLKPAIQLANEGYPISPVIGQAWQNAFKAYKTILNDPVFTPFFDTFTNKGKEINPGEIFTLKDHAKTLDSIAQTKGESFYKGHLAKKMATYIQKHGGFLSEEDLANHRSLWVDPISVNYRGYDIYELPPNGQGIITLQALGMLKHFDFTTTYDPLHMHYQIEAIKLAFEDGFNHIADPSHMRISVKELLDESYLKTRVELIKDTATTPKPSDPNYSGTVYLSTADKDGNMVSFIQSNYMGFGSGVVIPETGIAMQNRGRDFSLNEKSPNGLDGNKRSYHTIIPGFIKKDGVPIGPFGVMGGYMQPQGHLQVVQSMIDNNLNPQSALDKPRWQWIEGNRVKVESEMPLHFVEALKQRGHTVEIENKVSLFGRGQIIWRLSNGAYVCGVEKRTDSSVALY